MTAAWTFDDEWVDRLDMLILNHSHPHFDLTMEILCMLPKHPHGVNLSEMIAELRQGSWRDSAITNRKDLQSHFDKLTAMGIEVVLSHLGRNRKEAAIHHKDWMRALQLGQQYWDIVYEQ